LAFTLNKIFYIVAGLFILFVMIWYASGEHGDGIIWFSNRRTELLNFFFIHITKVGEEWTYVLLLIILLFYKFKEAILVFALAILVPSTSVTLKSFFAQPRPKKYFSDLGIFDGINAIEGIELYNAHTSFPSGHTISAFAVVGFAAFVFHRQKWLGILMIFLAISVAFSRVYLMQHFLIDVAAGAFLGCVIAYIVSLLSLRLDKSKAVWLNKNLLSFRKDTLKA